MLEVQEMSKKSYGEGVWEEKGTGNLTIQTYFWSHELLGHVGATVFLVTTESCHGFNGRRTNVMAQVHFELIYIYTYILSMSNERILQSTLGCRWRLGDTLADISDQYVGPYMPNAHATLLVQRPSPLPPVPGVLSKSFRRILLMYSQTFQADFTCELQVHVTFMVAAGWWRRR